MKIVRSRFPIIGTVVAAALLSGLAFGPSSLEAQRPQIRKPATKALPAAQPIDPCCGITAIDARAGLVTAKNLQTGKTFQFRVTDRRLLGSLTVGQKVYTDDAGEKAGLTPGVVCCGIVARAKNVTPALPVNGVRAAAAGLPTGPQVMSSQAQAAEGATAGRTKVVRPPRAARDVRGSRTVRASATRHGHAGEVVVTVTPAGGLVRAVASGSVVAEARGWDLYWRTLIRKINACKEKYPDDEKKRIACIDDAIVKTSIDLMTGNL